MTDRPPRPVRVLLIGMMGAGKTTVGRALAARTGWPYIDNDELVGQAAGVPTPELLVHGEQALRAAESAALQAVLALPPPLVGSVAGGVVTRDEDRARLRAGGSVVVWLRAAIDTLARRVGSGAGRAWLQPDPAAALRRLAADREPRYAELAALVVDVDTLRPDQVVDRILAGLPRA